MCLAGRCRAALRKKTHILEAALLTVDPRLMLLDQASSLELKLQGRAGESQVQLFQQQAVTNRAKCQLLDDKFTQPSATFTASGVALCVLAGWWVGL